MPRVKLLTSVFVSVLIVGLLTLVTSCDCEGDCEEDYDKCIEDIPPDPATGEPYNWDDYCADGYVSDDAAEITFCECAYDFRKCKDDC